VRSEAHVSEVSTKVQVRQDLASACGLFPPLCAVLRFRMGIEVRSQQEVRLFRNYLGVKSLLRKLIFKLRFQDIHVGVYSL
jgi:hypothetical protein